MERKPLRRSGAQCVQDLRLCIPSPYDVAQYRLVDCPKRLIEEYRGFLTSPQVREGNRNKIAAEQRLFRTTIKSKLHSPNLRHHLLLRIAIDELSEYSLLSVLPRHADDRIF